MKELNGDQLKKKQLSGRLICVWAESIRALLDSPPSDGGDLTSSLALPAKQVDLLLNPIFGL